jgi:hypothetical protein
LGTERGLPALRVSTKGAVSDTNYSSRLVKTLFHILLSHAKDSWLA